MAKFREFIKSFLPTLPIKSSRSAKRGSERPNTDAPLILLLPVEILLLFGDVLRPADLLSFSLSCKIMHTIFPLIKSKYDSLETVEKGAFLGSLEREVGNTHTFCSQCTKLHSFSRNLEIQYLQSFLRACSPGSFMPVATWTRGRVSLNYQAARLLAINHRYGSPKGIHPRAFFREHMESPLNQKFKFQMHPLWPSDIWHVTLDAKFYQDQFLLKATHRLRASSLEQAMRNRGISEYPLCAHAFVLPRKPKRPYRNDWKAIQVSDDGVAELNTVTECPQCPTEWMVDIHIGKHGVGIKVETYHLLGDISSHDDSLWLLMADRWTRCDYTRLRQAREAYRQGSVKAMWQSTC